MSKKLGWGMILVLLCGLVGFSVVHGADSGDVRAYFPLKVGNKWMYEVTLPDKNKVTQIIGIVPYEGDTFKMGVMFNDHPVEDVHFRETEKGIFKVKEITGAGTINYDPEQPLLPAKITAGSSWEWVSKVNNMKEKVTITSLKEKVEVPAGKFDAILVKSEGVDGTDASYIDLAYYVKGVGMVKEVFTASNQTRTIELIKYEVQ